VTVRVSTGPQSTGRRGTLLGRCALLKEPPSRSRFVNHGPTFSRAKPLWQASHTGRLRSVLEALCAFVRNGTKDGSDRSPATDIQAALIVIGRRRPGGAGVVDLTGAHLAKADLRKVNMSRADMIGADLSGADLSDADLSDANMTNDLMRNSNLTGADLKRGWLGGADLSGAKLSIAKLDGANMGDADLHHADLGVAHVNRASLLRAKLIGAKLIAADLLDSDLTGADLSDADLRGAVISQPQLDKACGTGAKLDPGLILKPCASPK